jgi:hypothetical protein
MLVWTAVIFAATLGQVRFAYYLGVNVALLAGFACDELLASAARFRPTDNRPVRWIAALALLIVVAVPAADVLRETWGRENDFSDDWYDALQWLQLNTPEPFEAGSYERPAADAQIEIPPRGYGVLAWWDYGYWITRVGRRIPNANPKQTQVKEVASFLVAQTEEAAEAALAPLGTRFVIVNAKLQHRSSMACRPRRVLREHPALDGTARHGLLQAVRPGVGQRVRPDAALLLSGVLPDDARTLYAFAGRRDAKHDHGDSVDRSASGQPACEPRLGAERAFGTYSRGRALSSRQRPTEHWRIASSNALVSCYPARGAGRFFVRCFSRFGRKRRPPAVGPSVDQITSIPRRLASLQARRLGHCLRIDEYGPARRITPDGGISNVRR